MMNHSSNKEAKSLEYLVEVRRVTLVGVVINIVIASMQLVAGLLAGSRALVADSVHTLSDLLSDGIVLVTAKLAQAPPDEEHPYGHGKFETLGTILLSGLLTVTGVGLAVNAIQNFDEAQAPHASALAFAFLCLVLKEVLYRYTIYVGRKIRSNLLIANAWHHRSDAISSLATLAGILGAVLGYPILDGVAAVVVGMFILRMALKIGWGSVQELLDTNLEFELLESIRSTARSTPGVHDIHALRARRMGPSVLVDLHIDVPGSLSVLEAHGIAEAVEQQILDRFSEVSEVLIHIDPLELGDGEASAPP